MSNSKFYNNELSTIKTEETIVYNHDKKFCYINLSKEHSLKLFSDTIHSGNIRMHDTQSAEVHMTIDSQFDTYLQKRKCVPLLCVIVKNKKELKDTLAQLEVYL